MLKHGCVYVFRSDDFFNIFNTLYIDVVLNDFIMTPEALLGTFYGNVVSKALQKNL